MKSSEATNTFHFLAHGVRKTFFRARPPLGRDLGRWHSVSTRIPLSRDSIPTIGVMCGLTLIFNYRLAPTVKSGFQSSVENNLAIISRDRFTSYLLIFFMIMNIITSFLVTL